MKGQGLLNATEKVWRVG